MTEEVKRRKNPTLALILSALIPGLGQIYNNQANKGITFIILNVVINFLLVDPIRRLTTAPRDALPDKPTLFIISAYVAVGLVLWLYAMIDAKRTADKMNREETNT